MNTEKRGRRLKPIHERDDERVALLAALEEDPERFTVAEREAIKMVYGERFSVPRAAAHLGVNVDTFRSRITGVRRMLRSVTEPPTSKEAVAPHAVVWARERALGIESVDAAE